MRYCTVLSVIGLLTGVTPLSAQRLQLFAEGGLSGGTGYQFRRVVIYPAETGYGRVQHTGRHEVGASFGARIGWDRGRWGVEAGASLTSSAREVTSQASGTAQPAAPPQSATITQLALRFRWETPLKALEVAAGPALIGFGGAAYRSLTVTALDSRATVGGSAVARLQVYRRGALGLNLQLEDAVYRVRLVAAPPGADTTDTPLQHDLRVAVGVAWQVR